MKKEKLQNYQKKPIRTVWDEEREEWYFSIVDVIGVLTNQQDARHASTYWAVMKTRLKEEGAEFMHLYINIADIVRALVQRILEDLAPKRISRFTRNCLVELID